MTGRRARRPRERTARPEVPPSVERYILAQRPQHRPLLRLLRKVVRDALPGAGEELKWGQPCYLVGGERVACLYVIGGHVNLGFFRGAELDDPRGVLEGSGQGMRQIRVGVPSDVKRRELTLLLRQAAGLETPRPVRGDPDRTRNRDSGTGSDRAGAKRVGSLGTAG
jgi:hypothetical protein